MLWYGFYEHTRPKYPLEPNAVAFEYKMDAILFLFIQLVQASVVS